MLYVYNVLAAILIGISIGTLLTRRNSVLLTGCLAAIVLGIITAFVHSWIPLVIGVAIFLVVQAMQRDHTSSQT
jgi:type IV secretory pathway TrbD component